MWPCIPNFSTPVASPTAQHMDAVVHKLPGFGYLATKDKPLIRLEPHPMMRLTKLWCCDHQGIQGWGANPHAAYENWKCRMFKNFGSLTTYGE